MLIESIWTGENFDSFSKEVHELCADWWKDTVFHSELKMPYNPDFEQFRQAAESGSLVSLTIRDDKKLVGLYLGIVCNHLFSKDIKILSEIFWCADREYRHVSSRLLKMVESFCSHYEIQFSSLSSPLHMNQTPLDLFINRKGYIMADKLFFKRH